MKKKLLSLALVLAMALTLLPTAAFAACEANAHDAVADANALTNGYTQITQATAEASWDCTTGFVKEMPDLTITDTGNESAKGPINAKLRAVAANTLS